MLASGAAAIASRPAAPLEVTNYFRFERSATPGKYRKHFFAGYAQQAAGQAGPLLRSNSYAYGGVTHRTGQFRKLRRRYAQPRGRDFAAPFRARPPNDRLRAMRDNQGVRVATAFDDTAPCGHACPTTLSKLNVRRCLPIAASDHKAASPYLSNAVFASWMPTAIGRVS